MPTFGIIAEGVTDQQVLERFVYALCDEDKPVINYLQPANPQEPGNWDRVLKYVASDRFRGAFQSNDFVIVHIDTDVCENFTPPIHRMTSNGAVPTAEIIERVRQRVIATIEGGAPGYYDQRKEQIIFAIAVHSIECWIMPLYCDRLKEKERQDNCLNLLNQRLKPLGFSIDENNKGKGYTRLLRDDKIRKPKRKTVLEISQYNPGFADFVAQVDARVARHTTDETEEQNEPEESTG